MRLVTFRGIEGGDRVGALIGDSEVLDLTTANDGDPSFANMLAFIEGGEAILERAQAQIEALSAHALLARSTVRLRPPIPLPPRMRGTSLDAKHLSQGRDGMVRLLAADGEDGEEAVAKAEKIFGPIPKPGWFETPIYYSLDQYCISGPDDHVTWPSYSQWIDYELEIAAIIGRRGRDIAVEDAGQYIFGYTILNDLSARDAQHIAMATGLSITAKGKDFEGSNAMGPCIVTSDEIKHGDMQAVLRVNGEEWGRGTPAGRHWTFEDAISYMSQAAYLFPGEILSSSTVAGCCGMEQARMGARGDCVELEVTGIGILTTYID